jgi:hypothetical protein
MSNSLLLTQANLDHRSDAYARATYDALLATCPVRKRIFVAINASVSQNIVQVRHSPFLHALGRLPLPCSKHPPGLLIRRRPPTRASSCVWTPRQSSSASRSLSPWTSRRCCASMMSRCPGTCRRCAQRSCPTAPTLGMFSSSTCTAPLLSFT